MEEIISRLELIKSCISLKEHSLVSMQANLLTVHYDTELDHIVNLIGKSHYSDALTVIDTYISARTGLAIYQDPHIQALKSEISLLGSQISELSTNKEEMLGLLDDFNREYHLHVGAIVSAILLLKKQVYQRIHTEEREAYSEAMNSYNSKSVHLKALRKQLAGLYKELDGCEMFSVRYEELSIEIETIEEEIKSLRKELESDYTELKEKKERVENGAQKEYQKSADDYENFSDEHEDVVNKEVNGLSEAEKVEFKKLYRKASKLCHPDRVGEDQKAKATELMVEVNQAYKAKDITRLRELTLMLAEGVNFDKAADSSNEKEWLLKKIDELRAKADSLLSEITAIKASDTWTTIVGIEDWVDYFNTTNEELKETLEHLKVEYEEA